MAVVVDGPEELKLFQRTPGLEGVAGGCVRVEGFVREGGARGAWTRCPRVDSSIHQAVGSWAVIEAPGLRDGGGSAGITQRDRRERRHSAVAGQFLRHHKCMGGG